MQDYSAWFRLVIAMLAVWRITHLLAQEDGPGKLILKIRNLLGKSFLGSLLDCFLCLSMWIAIPFTLYITRNPVDMLVSWLAISGGASILFKFQNRDVNDNTNIYLQSSGTSSFETEGNSMSCCGNGRRSLVLNINANREKSNQFPVSNPSMLYGRVQLQYTDKSTLTLIGKGTGNRYIFSPTNNIQNVDQRDVDNFLGTGKFRKID